MIRLLLAASISMFFWGNAYSQEAPYGASITWNHENALEPSSMPPGVSHHSFQSDLANEAIGYCVYVPPQYATDSEARFPVIHNLHGNGGDEFKALGVMALLHEQILEGIVPPMMMVAFNGGKSTFYKDSADGKFPIESIFINEFLPHIDQKYRTIAEGKARCIEGFSMGGRGATRLAMKYPHLFASLFCQAGNVPRLLDKYDAMTVEERAASLLGPDRANWAEDDVYAVTSKNRDKIKRHVRIRIACGSKDGGHLPTVRDFHDYLLDLKIDHTYIELEGLAHKRTEMIKRLQLIWFQYHVESLRKNGVFSGH